MYANPVGLLGTLPMREVPLLIQQVYEQQFNDSAWDVWIQGSEVTFAEYKEQLKKGSNQAIKQKEIADKSKVVREKEEKEAIDFASQFIKSD